MLMGYLDVVDRSWPVVGRLMGVHTVAYRATRGVIGHRVPGLPPMLLLDHVGAKSQKKRTSPLLYGRDGDDLVIVASKGGYTRSPGWYHNLLANPETTVQVGSRKQRVHAHKATAAERERLWPKMVAIYGSYEDYQRRTEREIPLIVLKPLAD